MCNFDHEHKICKKAMSWRNTIRIVFALGQIYLLAHWYRLYGWGMFEQYLTNWGIVMVLISLCASAYLPYCKDYKKCPGLMAFNHIMLSLAIVTEIIVSIVYWSVIHKDVMEKSKGNSELMFYNYISHILPNIACAYNFLVTDFLFYRGYSRFLFIMTGVYLFVNFLKTKMTGNVAYWFLRFDDLLSVYICIFFLSLAVFLPYGLANLTEFLKGRSLH